MEDRHSNISAPGIPQTPEQKDEAARTGELPVPAPHIDKYDSFCAHYLYIVFIRTKAGKTDVRPSLGDLKRAVGVSRSSCWRYRIVLEDTLGFPRPSLAEAEEETLVKPLAYAHAYDVFIQHYIYHHNRRTRESRFLTRPTVEEIHATSAIPIRTCEEYRDKYEGEFEETMAA